MTPETLLQQLEFAPVMEETVHQKLTKDNGIIQEIAKTAYAGDDFNLCKHTPATRLAVLTYLLLQKYDTYKSLGVSDDIIFDTFRDVSLRANLYYKRTGEIGITWDDVIWFRHIMNAGIFKIGTLQFQPFEMVYLDEATLGEPYMEFSQEQKDRLPNGSPVLNCHIQRGADICGKAVKESLEKADDFFRRLYPSVRYRAFICYSWLLYPPMLKSLPSDSNIQQFSRYFHIIGACSDSEQAFENIFGHGNSAKTTLQTMALSSKEQFGFACGVRFI